MPRRRPQAGQEVAAVLDDLHGVSSLDRKSRRVWRPSGLQLALQLVEEAEVGALGDDLLRARLDHARLLHAQRIEADRILGIVVSPLVVPGLV